MRNGTRESVAETTGSAAPEGLPPDPSWAGPDHDSDLGHVPNSETLLDCERCGRRAFDDAWALRRAVALGGALVCRRCLVAPEL